MKKHTWNNNQTQEAKGKRSSVDPKVVKLNVFYSLGCEWNLTLGFFQTNPWTLMPTTSPQEPTTTQILLSLTPPRGAFHSRKDALVTGETGYCMEFNTISLKEMKPVWCSWDWSGITEKHKEGYSTANFTLLPISSPFPTPLCASSKLFPWPNYLLSNIYVRNCENKFISVCRFSLSFSEIC